MIFPTFFSTYCTCTLGTCRTTSSAQANFKWSESKISVSPASRTSTRGTWWGKNEAKPPKWLGFSWLNLTLPNQTNDFKTMVLHFRTFFHTIPHLYSGLFAFPREEDYNFKNVEHSCVPTLFKTIGSDSAKVFSKRKVLDFLLKHTRTPKHPPNLNDILSHLHLANRFEVPAVCWESDCHIQPLLTLWALWALLAWGTSSSRSINLCRKTSTNVDESTVRGVRLCLQTRKNDSLDRVSGCKVGFSTWRSTCHYFFDTHFSWRNKHRILYNSRPVVLP